MEEILTIGQLIIIFLEMELYLQIGQKNQQCRR